MTSTLRDWLDTPRAGRGIHLADDAGGWEFREYADIAASAKRVAGALIAEGVRPGDVVCAILPTDFTCVDTIFGIWAAGATMCLITPPLFQDGDDYVAHVAAILRQAQPRLTVTSVDLEPLITRALEGADLTAKPWIPAEGEQVDPADIGELALLQFTSGSSGEPRGVMVTWRNLEANLDLISRGVGLRDEDEVASWLPLYHDMGLIGTFLGAVTRQQTLWLMRPDHFIRYPERWIKCFERAAHTAAPPFAFAYAARRVKAADLEGLDLSGWRTAIVGAEPIDPHSLESFAQLLEPYGFSRHTYKPAFGMAETTLLVTLDKVDRDPLAVHPDPDSLHFGKPVRIGAQHTLGPDSIGAKAGWVVGCGTPEDDVPVTICDDDGNELPEGYLGEIVVGGDSACPGYFAGRAGKSTRFIDDRVWTGDAGFFYEGQLFVLGRMGDSIKVRGRSVYVEDLESKVAEVTRLGKGRIVIVSVPGAGTKGVALFAESARGPWVEDARELLRRRLGDDVEVTIVVGSGLIQRTSSGKPRRRYMWELLDAGRLPGATILHPGEQGTGEEDGLAS